MEKVASLQVNDFAHFWIEYVCYEGVVQSNIQISQGSAAIDMRRGDIMAVFYPV